MRSSGRNFRLSDTKFGIPQSIEKLQDEFAYQRIRKFLRGFLANKRHKNCYNAGNNSYFATKFDT